MYKFKHYLRSKINISKGLFFWLLSMLPILLFILFMSYKNNISTQQFRNLEPEPVHQKALVKSYGNIPMHFEQNHGQIDDQVKFLSRGRGYTLFLTPNEAVLLFQESGSKFFGPDKKNKIDSSAISKSNVVSIKLAGSNSSPQIKGVDKLNGKSHYFIGNNAENWYTDIPNYAKVQYTEVYPGIDLIYYGNQRQLEYDFIIAPYADPSLISLRFEGADHTFIDDEGNLILKTNDEKIVFNAPEIYQEIEGKKKKIDGAYNYLNALAIEFNIGSYDEEYPLIIDPKLSYSTYLGGSGDDIAWDIAVDTLGNAYVTGETSSADFPTTGLIGVTIPTGRNIFISKINPDGTALIYSAYIGGSGWDMASAIAVDSTGNAYITGSTRSSDFPTLNPFDAVYGSTGIYSKGFVAKINPEGNALVFSTYLGGTHHDRPRGIAVDQAANVYVGGYTSSVDFPTANPYQTFPGDYEYGNTSRAFGNIFISKLNPTGNGLIYSTYIGGSHSETCNEITIDSLGFVYLTGFTYSTDYPTVNPYQLAGNTSKPGWTAAVVSILDSSGTSLVYSTYLTGSGADYGNGIALDKAGCIYVTGNTYSSDFPMKNALMGPPIIMNGAGFITKFNPAGNSLIYSSYLTGTDHSTTGYGVVADEDGNAYISGHNNASDFPIADPITPGVQFPGSFIYKLDSSGTEVLYSTSLRNSFWYQGNKIVLDRDGNIYITGVVTEWAPGFPTVNALQSTLGGEKDAFVAKFSEDRLEITKITPDPYSDSTEWFWVEGTLRPGEKWTFKTNFRYTLASADIGEVILEVGTLSGLLLGEKIVQVNRGTNVLITDFESPEITVPEVGVDEVDTLYVEVALFPGNELDPTASDFIPYRVFIHKWTFMVYLDGDNNLEWESVDDFLELTDTPSNDSIVVVMQYDRHPEYDNGWFNEDGSEWSDAYGWEDTRRIFDHRDYYLEESLGEQNMGDPTTLRNFVQWGMKKFPAQHYALVLWNHGGGWREAAPGNSRFGLPKQTTGPQFPGLPPDGRGLSRNYRDVAVDDTDNDVLYSAEIRMALRGLPKLDILAFDACLMSMTENAYQYRESADYMVGSEALEPYPGWPYDKILARLHASPKMAANLLANVIVEEYGWSYPPDDWDITQTAINLWEIEGVASALDELAAILIQNRPWEDVEDAIKQSKYFWPTENRDLNHFARLLKNISTDPTVQEACDKLLVALNRTVIANYFSSAEVNSFGLSIFLPEVMSRYDASYDQAENIQLSDDTLWDEFLRLYLSRGLFVDTFEPNNSLHQAYGPLFPESDYYSYFPYPGDQDFYFFTTGSVTDLSVKLTSPAINWDVAVFDFNGTLLGKSSSTTSYDTLGLMNLPASFYYIEVISNESSVPDLPYKLEVDYQGSRSGQLLLSSDDDLPDSSLFSTNAGDVIGMQFHAPTYPMILDEISLYIESIDGAGTGGDGSFFVWLADYYGTIMEPLLVTPALGALQKSAQVPGWFDVALSDSGIVLQSDFVVGIGYDGTNTPTLGIDSLDNGRTFQWASATKNWRPIAGSAFIRAKVSYLQALDRVGLSLPAELQVEADDTVSVPIRISNLPAAGIDSLDLEIYYQSSELRFTGISRENSLTSAWQVNSLDSQPAGRIYVSMSGGNKISSAGDLFNIKLHVNQAAVSDTVEMFFNKARLNGGEYLVETKSGNIIIKKAVSVRENPNQPGKFALMQNYPNPFNPTTTIKFELPKTEEVKIEVFNFLGQKVRTLIDDQLPIGFYEVKFDAKDLSSGIYVYKLTAGQYQAVKKMLFLK